MLNRKNPFRIDDNLCISFSGGRTSAYMLYRYLDHYDGTLPENTIVTFANTGKEMLQTLDFVRDCEKNWGVKIHWIELARCVEVEKKGSKRSFHYEYKEVDYLTASRKGEPFEILIRGRGMLPNPVSRFCTASLKIRAVNRFIQDFKGWDYWDSAIGIRVDENSRVVKILSKRKSDKGYEILPLWAAGIGKKTVYDFWSNNNFDLRLPNNGGVTEWGNCDLCFLKGYKKRVALVREEPKILSWWENMERESNQRFSVNSKSYEDIGIIARSGDNIGYEGDLTIPCFCGD